MSPNPEKITINLSACEKLPHEPGDLIRMPGIDQYVAAYNARMRAQFEDWEDLPGAAILEDANFALAVEHMWQEDTEISGPIQDILAINEFVRYAVEQIKNNDLLRVLDEEEVATRLETLGISLKEIREQCENFYRRSGYVRKLREKGVLGKKEVYKLPSLVLTEGQMQNLEQAHFAEGVDALFIDDGRLSVDETATALQFQIHEDSRETLAESQALSSESLKEVISKDLTVKNAPGKLKRLRKKGEDESGIRFIFFEYPERGENQHPEQSFIGEIKADYRRQPLDAGTYMRLLTFLHKTDPESATALHYEEYLENNVSIGGAGLGVMLNAVLPNGRILEARSSATGVRFMPVNPRKKQWHGHCPMVIIG